MNWCLIVCQKIYFCKYSVLQLQVGISLIYCSPDIKIKYILYLFLSLYLYFVTAIFVEIAKFFNFITIDK